MLLRESRGRRVQKNNSRWGERCDETNTVQIGKKRIYLPETISVKIELRKHRCFSRWSSTSLSRQTIRTTPRLIHDNRRRRRPHNFHHKNQFRNQSSSIIESLRRIPAPTIRQENRTRGNEGDGGSGNGQVIWPGKGAG